MKKRITSVALFVIGLATMGWAQTTEEESHIQVIIADDNGTVFELDTAFEGADFDLDAILAAYDIDLDAYGEGEMIEKEVIIEVNEWTSEDGEERVFMDGDHHGMMMMHHMDGGEMKMEIEGEDGETHEITIDKEMDEDGNMTMTILMDGEPISEEDMTFIHEMHEDMDGMGHSMVMNRCVPKDGMCKMECVNGSESKCCTGEGECMIKCTVDNEDHTCMSKCMNDMDVRIEKTVDEDGNVTIKKYVNGEEVEHDFHGMDHHGAWVSDGDNVCVIVMSSITKFDEEENSEALKNLENKSELTVNELSFNPNPNNGLFDLNFTLEEKGKTQLRIVDVSGKAVYEEDLGRFEGSYSNSIDITKEGPGIYFLQILQGDKAMAEKIVIR